MNNVIRVKSHEAVPVSANLLLKSADAVPEMLLIWKLIALDRR
jgi:hypothetical protein